MDVKQFVLFATLLGGTPPATFAETQQNAKVTLNMRNVSIKEILNEVESQTNYLFVIDNNVNLNKKVSVNVKASTLKNLLQQVLIRNGYAYEVKEHHIIISKTEQWQLQKATNQSTSFQSTVKGDKKTLMGKVVDAKTGEPVIGASVRVKNSKMNGITNVNGEFQINNIPGNAELIVSYIGYEESIVHRNNLASVIVQLKEKSKSLDEVVVVGYGSQKKVNLTGAITSIDSKALDSRPVTTTTSALQGVIPNLQVTSSSGAPGSGATLNVRGTTSINGGSPLVLVDGVEMDLNIINPNDIANVTVLKDAAAAAIYGVRAAFGVVLVTTKNAANNEKTMVSYSGNVAFSKPTILPKMVKTSWEHAEFINGAMANAGLDLLYDPATVQKMKDYANNPTNNPEYEVLNGQFYYYGYSDWVKLMLKKLTPSQRHNINISGGNKKTKFYTSLGYVNQSGLYKIGNDDYKRINTRISVENQTTQWMKLGFRALYNYIITNEPHLYKDSPWQQMVFSTPTQLARKWEQDSRYPELNQYAGRYFDDQNPISLLDEGGRDISSSHDVWLTASADFNFAKDWHTRIDFTYNLNYGNSSAHRKAVEMLTKTFVETEGNTNNNSFSRTNTNKSYYSFNAYTEYEHTFASKHYIKGMLGFNQELTKYVTSTATRQNLISQQVPSLSLGTGLQTVSDNGYEWALRGGFFRLNYIYDSKYLIEFNGRYDGTSRFPSDNRFVFLPSFSAGWRISEESFMASTRSWLDNLKLRMSYGELGNQLLSSSSWSGNTKYYPYIPFMSSGNVSNWLFTDNEKSLYINPAGLVSSSLTWEKARTVNVGIDFTILRSRLDVSFDWYQRTTSDMLIKVEYPEVLGTTAPPANMAALRTRGWELSMKWNDHIGKDFKYGLILTLSDSQAEITKYTNPINSLSDYYVGMKIGEIWGYETEGLFQSDDEVTNHADQSKLGSNWESGDIKYKDLNGDNKINNGANTLDDHGDLKVIGNTTPRYQYSITANLSYKNWYMNIFFQGIGKRDFWPSAQAFWPASTPYYNTQTWFVTDSWSEDNRNAYFARPIARETKNQNKQTRYLQNASYCRLKSLSLGYNLPLSWIKFLHISSANIYVSGENLLEISKIKGPYDPEAAIGNGSMLYPFQRTYSFGINLTF